MCPQTPIPPHKSLSKQQHPTPTPTTHDHSRVQNNQTNIKKIIKHLQRKEKEKHLQIVSIRGRWTCLVTNMAAVPLTLHLLPRASSPKKHHLFLIHISIFFLISLCNPQFSFSISEDDALIKFKKSLKNTTSLDSSWVKGTSPCEKNKRWARVQCERNVVEGLLLGEAGLSGELDIDPLIALPGLRVLDIANNSFSGLIPEFFLLGALKSIYIDGNQFSGEIPKDFFAKMGSLKKIWLARNKFSGAIPESLASLKYLMELRLESNAFTGRVPSLSQGSLTSIDFTNNKLQGEIPQEMSKFGADPFKGNEELCGKQLGKECKEMNKTQSAPMSKLRWILLGIVVCILLVTILFRVKRKEDHFDKLGKENLDEGLHIASSIRKSMSIHSKGGDSIRGGSTRRGGGSQSGKAMGDLVLVNNENGTFGLPDLMKAAAEVLGNGVLGSAYKAKMGNGMSVVVKRLREMNKMNRDVFDAEMRKLGKLRHKNLLQLLAYHYRKEEKLMVSEYVPRGSLLYLLHGMTILSITTSFVYISFCLMVRKSSFCEFHISTVTPFVLKHTSMMSWPIDQLNIEVCFDRNGVIVKVG